MKIEKGRVQTDQFGRECNLCLYSKPETTAAFGIVPLPDLCTHLEMAPNCDVRIMTSRSTDYDSPSVSDWNEEHIVDLQNDVSSEKVLFEECSARTSNERKSNVMPAIGPLRAAHCTQGSLTTSGPFYIKLAMRLANDALDNLNGMIHIRGGSNNADKYCDSVAAALQYQPTAIKESGTQYVGSTRRLLDVAVTLTELVSNAITTANEDRAVPPVPNQPMTESAVRPCLIGPVPKLFGEKSLKRLTDIIANKNPKRFVNTLSVRKIQHSGVSNVSAVPYTSEDLYEVSGSGAGVMMDCIRQDLSPLNKNAKPFGRKLVDITLRCLEFGKGGGNSPGSSLLPYYGSDSKGEEGNRSVTAPKNPTLDLVFVIALASKEQVKEITSPIIPALVQRKDNTDQFVSECSLCLSAELATTTAFGIVPLAGSGTCLAMVRNSDINTRVGARNAFASRLNDDSPPMDWNGKHMTDLENDVPAAQLLLNGCSTCNDEELKSNDLPPIGLLSATHCSQGLLQRSDFAYTTLSRHLANYAIERLDESTTCTRGGSNNRAQYRAYVPAALRCQSTVVLGTQDMGVIPRLTYAAGTLIELDVKVKTTANDDSDNAQRLKSLTDIIGKHPKVLVDSLGVGMRQLPGVYVVSAVPYTSAELDEHDASTTGVRAMMYCLRECPASLKKVIPQRKVLDRALRYLEVGGGSGNTPSRKAILFHRSIAANEPLMSVWNLAVKRGGNLVTTLTPRLPESEFKVVLDGMAHRGDAGTSHVQTDVGCKGVPLHKKLLREVPLHGLALSQRTWTGGWHAINTSKNIRKKMHGASPIATEAGKTIHSALVHPRADDQQQDDSKASRSNSDERSDKKARPDHLLDNCNLLTTPKLRWCSSPNLVLKKYLGQPNRCHTRVNKSRYRNLLNVPPPDNRYFRGTVDSNAPHNTAPQHREPGVRAPYETGSMCTASSSSHLRRTAYIGGLHLSYR